MMGLDLKRARGEGNNSLTDDQWIALQVLASNYLLIKNNF
jgi:hypothetical protein